MHGYNHLYDNNTYKNDLFNMVVIWAWSPKDKQKEKIKTGLKIFKDNNIKVRLFFANHTKLKYFRLFKRIEYKYSHWYYGLKLYKNIFIPQLFYKLFLIFELNNQIHLNEWPIKIIKILKNLSIKTLIILLILILFLNILR